MATLLETNSSPLKIDPWKRKFLLETTIFRGYVSFREGNQPTPPQRTPLERAVGCLCPLKVGRLCPSKVGPYSTLEKRRQDSCETSDVTCVPVVPHKAVAEVSKIGNL